MNLIIVRHAAAIERSSAIPEEQRSLTAEGRAFFRKTARTMKKKGIDPDLILTSPLLRAVQTADILAESFSYDGELMVVEEISPGFDMTALQDIFKTHQSKREVALVGHEPDLSRLISSLLALSDGFNFKKGTAIKLKIDPTSLGKPAAFKWLAAGNKLITDVKEAFE